MPNTDDHDLESVLHRLRIVLQQPLEFSRTDTETTLTKIRLLTAAAHYFNVLAVSDFGGRLGAVRADGLVEQAVAAAFQTFGGLILILDRSRRPLCSCAGSRKDTRSTMGTSALVSC